MKESESRHRPALLALIAAALLPVPVRGQDLDVAVHAGTMGLGADVIALVRRDIGLRASFNYIPFDINIDEDSVDFTLDLPAPQVLLVADFYPVERFRLSGGVLLSSKDYEVIGRLREPVEIGNTVYTPAQVGTLTGTVTTRNVSPYIGIGFGNSDGSRVALFADLGLAFHGNPELSAEADGPVASLPGFQQDLDIEVREIEDDIENVIVYPVFSVGISIRLGR